MSTPADLPCWKDYEFEIDLSAKASTTGVLGAAAGVTGLTAYVELTLGAGAVDAALSKALTERSATPGRYSCVFDQADLAQHVAAADGKRVWICVKKSGDIDVERFARIARATSRG